VTSLELAGESPVIDIKEAWQTLTSGRMSRFSSGGVYNGIAQRKPANSQRLRVWQPEYQPGATVDLYGYPTTYTSAEGNGAAVVYVNGVRLEGDQTILNALGSTHVEKFDLTHAWGTLRQETSGGLVLTLAGTEPYELYQAASELSFTGTIKRDQGLVLLQRQDGKTFVVPNAPANLPDGIAVMGYGWNSGRVQAGYPVLEWMNIQSPPDASNAREGGIGIASAQAVGVQQAMVPPPPSTPTAALPGDMHAQAVPNDPATPHTAPPTLEREIDAGETCQSIAAKYGVSGAVTIEQNKLNGNCAIDIVQVPTLKLSTPATTSVELTPRLEPAAMTVPFTDGQRVEALEGNVSIFIIEDENGANREVHAFLYEQPLDPQQPGWQLPLVGPNLRGIEELFQLRAKVWGRVRFDAPNSAVIEVERFEKADPNARIEALSGELVTTTIEGKTVLLLKGDDGKQYVLASSIRWPVVEQQQVDAGKVTIVGVLRPETFGGYPVIDEYGRASGQGTTQQPDLQQMLKPPRQVRVTPSKGIVEQVELVYLADDATVMYNPDGSRAAPDASRLIVRPMWRFAGHTERGESFEALIEALPESQLEALGLSKAQIVMSTPVPTMAVEPSALPTPTPR
jgi:hypothetical protein